MYGDCQVMQQSSSSMMMGGGGHNHVGVAGVGTGTIGIPMSMNMNMNMNMNSIPSDPLLFSSPVGNSSHFSSFIPTMPPFHSFSSIIPKEEAGLIRKEEEMDSGSGSGQIEGLSCGEEHDTNEHHHGLQQEQQQQQQDQNPQQLVDASGKKKRYHRHTARQIQEMEALFKECPHPDDKQRMRLSQELGLKPRQVKFWFQNRRTQMKAQQDRADNVVLRAENESLKNENFRLQTTMRNVVCPNCGGPAIIGELSFDEQHLRLENARLKEELERLSCIAARYGGRPVHHSPALPPLLLPSLDLDMGIYSRHFNDQHSDMLTLPPPSAIPNGHYTDHHPHFSGMVGTGGFVRDQDKPVVLELALSASEQLVRMCRTNEPLWVRNGGVAGGEKLDLEEYGRMFGSWPKLEEFKEKGFRVEGTRDSGHVMMNSITLVDAFLDVNKWMELFPSIVSNAKTLQVITPGIADNGNESLQLMYAEFQVLSPLVPTRETYFFRYCHHNMEEGFWSIVDFPVDGFQESIPMITVGYKRRPSGFIFQDMSNGYAMVTWVEQAEVEIKEVHQIFDEYSNSGTAFGASRWLAVLQNQCNRLASLMARNVSDLGVIPSPEARKNMMRLSHRMIRTFCSSISLSGSGQPWTALSDSSNDTVRITTRKNTEPGQPNGVILTAVSTAWLPFSHIQVFELLTDEQRRSQLDVLSNGNSLHEVAHIANGSHQKDCVSLFRINSSSNSSQNVELMLQESSTHPTGGSLVVYTTIDVDAVQVAMSGEDPSYIPLLPTGFVVTPAAPPVNYASGNENPAKIGCLLTVGIQVLASAVPSAKLNLSSVTAINNHLCNAVNQISTELGGGGGTTDVDSLGAAAAAAVSDH